MKINFKSLAWRITVGISVPLLLISGIVFLYVVKKGPPCLFFEITGLYCAGCGSGRATVALLHGDVLSALDFNIFYVALLPFLSYLMLKYYIYYVFGKDVLPFFKIGVKTALFVLAITVVFGIIRNIPAFPFVYLAP